MSEIAAAQTPGPDWLVSVQSVAEARLVLPYQPTIIDWKDPGSGPLAPTSVEAWNAAADFHRNQTQARAIGEQSGGLLFSAALGESEQALVVARHVPQRFRFAKVGPSGCGDEQSLADLWRRVSGQLAAGVELVPVAYADHQAAQSLDCESVMRLAIDLGYRRLLIDTFDKGGGGALSWLADTDKRRLRELADQHRCWWAMAGSLTLGEAKQLAKDPATRPDCFAVRGDVCQGDRLGALSRQRLEAWAQWKADTAKGLCLSSETSDG